MFRNPNISESKSWADGVIDFPAVATTCLGKNQC